MRFEIYIVKAFLVAFVLCIVMCSNAFGDEAIENIAEGAVKENAKPILMTREQVEKLGISYREVPDEKNAAILYQKAIELYVPELTEIAEISKYVINNKWIDNESFLKRFERNQECLKIVHAAVNYGDCQFPYYYRDDPNKVSNTCYPYLSTMRDLSVLLSIEAKKNIVEGRIEKAIDSAISIGKLNKHLFENEPVTQLTQLVCMAICLIQCDTLGELIANHDLSEKQLNGIINALNLQLEMKPGLVHAYHVESKIFCELLDEALYPLKEHDSVTEIFLALDEKKMGVDQSILRMVRDVIGNKEPENIKSSDVIAVIKSKHFELLNELDEWLKMPDWEALKPRNSFKNHMKGKNFVLSFMLNHIDHFREKYTALDARRKGLLIFAVIKQYEKRTGKYPKNLKELISQKIIAELPIDPFSGKDFRYKTKKDDWILYSIGENLKDDGGSGQMPQKLTGSNADKDIVFWSKPIPYEEPAK
jgi:hypothetical protein